VSAASNSQLINLPLGDLIKVDVRGSKEGNLGRLGPSPNKVLLDAEGSFVKRTLDRVQHFVSL